jgi:acetoin utilization protein AcuB
MFVKEIMTSNPITVTTKITLPQIVSLLREKQIRRVLVVDDGKLVGIISDHDVDSIMPSPATTLSRWEMNTLLDKLTAGEIMTSPVFAIGPDCPLEEAARALLEKKFGALPVLQDGALVGIVTESDIFSAFVEMLSGGDVPGLRFVLQVEEGRGVLAQLASIVNDNGGNIIAIATMKADDEAYRRILVKEEGADPVKVKTALEEVDIEVVDVRERGVCGVFQTS